MNIISYYTFSRSLTTEILGRSTESNADSWSKRNGISKLWSNV